jgi:protein-S-isoprenylcysteine O-methyltransferase Ste14
MRKGPLIAAGVQFVIGIVMVIVGSIFYDSDLTTWNDWVLWFGIIIFGIGLIVMVVAFIKKPSADDEPAKKSE